SVARRRRESAPQTSTRAEISAAPSVRTSSRRASPMRPKSVSSTAASKAAPSLITAAWTKNHSTPETKAAASQRFALRRARSTSSLERATHSRKTNSPASATHAARWTKRSAAVSSATGSGSDLESELAARHVAVGGKHAPHDAVPAGRERRQRDLEDFRLG